MTAAGIDKLVPFEVPIYGTQLAGFEAHHDALVALIRGLRKTTKGRATSLRGGWQSSTELHALTDESLLWVRGKMLAFARSALASTYANWSSVELDAVGFWANVSGRGAWHTPHHHLPCNWSSVVYIDVESSIVPNDTAALIEFINPIPFPASFAQPSSVAYAPSNGLAFLFPGALMHMVNPNSTDAERISMSFNFSVTPRAR
jgi:uncharacterized protein (TIGR02466 family)